MTQPPLSDLFLQNGPYIRLGCFIGLLTLMGILERLIPQKNLLDRRSRRWPINLSIVIIDTLAVRVLVPILPLSLALTFEIHGWGLLNSLDMSLVFKILLTILAFDFIIWAQHRIFHRIPLLWRIHRMHHTDVDVDTTTGVRFHPIEILLSIVIKLAAVALLGASALGVLLFEILLNATSLFNHANIRLPKMLDTLIRLVIVTPDMHRVHHSVDPVETDSNFGFNLTWWDHLFGTYRAEPKLGQTGVKLGLNDFQEKDKLSLLKLLIMPFK